MNIDLSSPAQAIAFRSRYARLRIQYHLAFHVGRQGQGKATRTTSKSKLDFLDQGFHCEAFGSVEFCQAIYHALSVSLGSVLAHLPFALKPLDR